MPRSECAKASHSSHTTEYVCFQLNRLVRLRKALLLHGRGPRVNQRRPVTPGNFQCGLLLEQSYQPYKPEPVPTALDDLEDLY